MPANPHEALVLSPELQAAQERLLQLRKELPAKKGASHRHFCKTLKQAPQNHLLQQAQVALSQRRELEGVRVNHGSPCPSSDWLAALKEEYLNLGNSLPPTEPVLTRPSDTVPAYPSLLIAMLKENLAPAGRIYLLLRHLDPQGRGWLSVDRARDQLTTKSSQLRVCGWRRLRQILHQGEGIFWQRDPQDRLWLHAPHRIGQKLGVERLQGTRINLPVKCLLGGIQAVRAHFYAAYHSGRRKPAPFSRERLKDITGLPDRTQRAYDHIAQVKRERNIAIGPRYTKETAETQAWLRGRGLFRFVDSQGRQGRRTASTWPGIYPTVIQDRTPGAARGGRKESTGD